MDTAKVKIHCDAQQECVYDPRCVNFKHCRTVDDETINAALVFMEKELDRLAERVAQRIIERNLLGEQK